MAITHLSISTLAGLKAHIRSGRESLYCGSKTSTVIDFTHLERLTDANSGLWVVDLSGQAKCLETTSDGLLKVRGGVTWSDAMAWAAQSGQAIKTLPSEPLACVLSGCATSVSGERGFAFGGFRDHIASLTYLDDRGEENTLSAQRDLARHPWFAQEPGRSLLSAYQAAYAPYHRFKNGPVPRLQRETDLLVGSEGQLGVVIEVILEMTPAIESLTLMLELPPWERNFSVHQALFDGVQAFRDCVMFCEFVDHNCLRLVDAGGQFGKDVDLIFLHLRADALDRVAGDLISVLPGLDASRVFQVPDATFATLRTDIPRQIAEANRRHRTIKRGTDIQVAPDRFGALVDRYRQASRLEIPTFLFGHFGDAHLHFNFLPNSDQLEPCDGFLDDLYADVRRWHGTP